MSLIGTKPKVFAEPDINHVSRLQEITQKLGLPLPRYADDCQECSSVTPFAMVVVLDLASGGIHAVGAPASTKKQAKQLAAKAMLAMPEIKDLNVLMRDRFPNVASSASDDAVVPVNYIGALLGRMQARQMPQPVYTDILQEGPAHMPRFTVKVTCNFYDGLELASATGAPCPTRTQAKQSAAKAVLESGLLDIR